MTSKYVFQLDLPGSPKFIRNLCMCVLMFVYSLQASWKHTILTPHMAATSTISPTRLCRAVICECKITIWRQKCTFELLLNKLSLLQHAYVRGHCAEKTPNRIYNGLNWYIRKCTGVNNGTTMVFWVSIGNIFFFWKNWFDGYNLIYCNVLKVLFSGNHLKFCDGFYSVFQQG